MHTRAVCRICLAGSAGNHLRLHCIDDRLLGIYEKLTNAKLSTGDSKHNTLCYICYSQLQKCYRFSDMAHRSEKYLRDVLKSDTKVNKEMASVLNLMSLRPLTVQTLRPMSLDGLTKGRTTKPIVKKKQLLLAVRNEPTKGINKKVRLFKKENIKEVLTIKKETAEEGYIKIDDNKKGLIEKDSIKEVIIKKEVVTTEKINIKIEVDSNKNEEFPEEINKDPHKILYNKRTEEKYNIENITQCLICKKMFSTKSQLANHMRIHGERPYTCDYCDHAVRIKQHLIEHLRIHTGEKVYCKVCKKGFTHRVSLWRHMFIHTGEQRYCCHICGRSFKQSCQMRSHIRFVHEGVKPHRCEVCNKRFSGKIQWKRHMEGHSETKAYSCDKCQTRFTTKASKSRHMKYYCK